MFKLAIGIYAAYALLVLSFFAILGYVAYHFISKLW